MSESRNQRLLAQTSQAWAPADVTDFGIGQPNDAILPVEILARAAASHFSQGLRYPLQYGTERGDGSLRLALGEFLSGHYGLDVDPEPILITNGNSQAIDLVCGALTKPGDVVLVEDPSYHLALDIFRDHQLRLVGVPVDADGLSIDALVEALDRHRPALVYTIPSYHNPTGVTLSATRCQQLVDLALEHQFLIVADEVYHLLRYRNDNNDPAPMAAHVGSGVVLSLGTFSKILAPGLRLGWIQAAEPLLARLAARGFIVSGGGLNPFTSALVAVTLSDGSVDQYLAQLRTLLATRVATMDAGLRAHFPADIGYEVPTGGYFFWLRFTDGVATPAFTHRAQAHKVGFRPGNLFSITGGLANHMRLSFAYYDIDRIEAGLAVLGQVIRTGS